jgi:hypothetical protein
MAQDPRALLQKVSDRFHASPISLTLIRQKKRLKEQAEGSVYSAGGQKNMRMQQTSIHKPPTPFECKNKVQTSAPRFDFLSRV